LIEAVNARGYPAVSVAEVSRLAGVSKRTFYEQFADKEACFLATYDSIVDCALQRIDQARAWHERDWEGGLRGAFEAFVLAAAEQPKAARLALIDVFGAGPVAVERLERARARLEQSLAAGIREAPHAAPLPPVVLRGIVYGFEHVVRANLLSGSDQRLMGAAGELATWALAQTSPAVAELAQASRTTNGGWPRLRERDDERARLGRAAVEIVVRDGQDQLTTAAILARARLPEPAFRRYYVTAEECFLDALDLVALEALTSAAAASRTAGDGPRGACRGIVALISYVVEDPLLRRIIQLDSYAADTATIVRRERRLSRFADLLATRLPRSQRPPSVLAQAAVGSVWGVICHYVTNDATRLLPDLVDQLAYVALAPLVGSETAVATILAEHDLDPAMPDETRRRRGQRLDLAASESARRADTNRH